jgi:hypothetical protein
MKPGLDVRVDRGLDLHDVGVRHFRRHPHVTQEALDHLGRVQALRQDALEGDLAARDPVAGAEDLAHSTRAQLLHQNVRPHDQTEPRPAPSSSAWNWVKKPRPHQQRRQGVSRRHRGGQAFGLGQLLGRQQFALAQGVDQGGGGERHGGFTERGAGWSV